eukprot:Selendium_serpulae@DN3577_c0_g1_i1.p1
MRQLKYHEQKLLKKTDFLNWKRDNSVREAKVIRKYQITDREDYHKYLKITGYIRKLTAILRKMPKSDEFRVKTTDMLLDKMVSLGVLPKKTSLEDLEELPVSRFCQRRLATILFDSKYSQKMGDAVALVEQGHFRIGPNVVNNPALHITPDMEDHLTWADGSKIKRHIKTFNDEVDDFELLGA